MSVVPAGAVLRAQASTECAGTTVCFTLPLDQARSGDRDRERSVA